MKIIWLTKLTDQLFRNTQLMMSDYLRKKGNEVTLILAKYFPEKRENKSGIYYLPLFNIKILSGFIYGIIILFYFPYYVKKKQVDIVIVSGDTIWSPFLLSLIMIKIPVIMDVRSLEIDTERSILKDISFSLSRYLTDGLTTITPELANILKKRYKLQDKKIGIWSSGFSKNQFNALEGNVRTNNNDKFVLLHHGTYSPSRGVEELIHSIAYIDEDMRKKIKLTLVGIPSNKIQDLTNFSKELNIHDQIELIPPVNIEKIPMYIQSCDVGIVPLSPTNKWWRVSAPLKTIEYLAMGKPIIATNIPFHQKIFDKASCGVLLNTNNPKDIADAIIYLYQNRNKLSEMGKEGKEFVENFYGWESKASELDEFLTRILASK